ncbi:MAG: hypothetical protein ACR2MD_09100 [Aridibacter sp.]
MVKVTEHTEIYIKSILQDIRNHFVEETLSHSANRIEREYKFEDGAVIKYEWQNAPRAGSANLYNHRFSLINPPKPNPYKLKTGIVKVINYPQ